MKKHSGFTLIELTITMALVSTLLVVGVPSLQGFMKRNQLIAASNELLSAMHIARSEAIRFNTRVSICDSTDGTSCSFTGNWKDGWIVFVDADGNLRNNGSNCSTVNTDCILRVHSGFDDNHLRVNGLDANAGALGALTFTSRGLPKAVNGAAQSGTFSLCRLADTGTTLESRAIVVSYAGKARVSDNPAAITCP